MNVALEQHATDWLIRLTGEVTLASSEELKALLLQWLAAGRQGGTTLELDLEQVQEVDITILQLLCAVAREAARAGVQITSRASDEVRIAMRDAGFDQVPGFPIHLHTEPGISGRA